MESVISKTPLFVETKNENEFKFEGNNFLQQSNKTCMLSSEIFAATFSSLKNKKLLHNLNLKKLSNLLKSPIEKFVIFGNFGIRASEN